MEAQDKSNARRESESRLSDVEKELAMVEAMITEHKSAIDSRSGRSGQESAKVVSATRVEKAVETAVEHVVTDDVREVRREVWSPRKYGPLIFYFFSSLICIGILAYLFGSMTSFVAFFIFSMFLWWSSHQFHVTKSGMLKSFLVIGFFSVILYLLYWVVNDSLSLLFCVIYSFSFVLAAVLYFYHSRRELSEEIHKSFSRTFLVVFYSHVVAFTASSLLAYLLPLVILGEGFVSMDYIFIAWALPVLFVYFFLTRFLYLRFFDRKHPLSDALKSILHGALYAVVFIAIVLLSYLMTAVQFVMMERAAYSDVFSEVLTTIPNVKSELASAEFSDGAGVMGLKVTQEVLLMSEQALSDATELKESIESRQLVFDDYISDNYFTVFVGYSSSVARTVAFVLSIDDLKKDILREYFRLKSAEEMSVFSDGSSNLDEHYYALSEYVDGQYFHYSEPPGVSALRQRLADANSYSEIFSDSAVLDFNTLSNPDLRIFLPDGSRFSSRFLYMVYHTVLFRDLMLLAFDSSVVELEAVLSPEPLSELYSARGEEESMDSKVLRYRILKSNSEAISALGSTSGSDAEKVADKVGD